MLIQVLKQLYVRKHEFNSDGVAVIIFRMKSNKEQNIRENMYYTNAVIARPDLLLVMDIYRESEIASAGKHFR